LNNNKNKYDFGVHAIHFIYINLYNCLFKWI
jgi:hypothetical protein